MAASLSPDSEPPRNTRMCCAARLACLAVPPLLSCMFKTSAVITESGQICPPCATSLIIIFLFRKGNGYLASLFEAIVHCMELGNLV